jgi:hypothetical protein
MAASFRGWRTPHPFGSGPGSEVELSPQTTPMWTTTNRMADIPEELLSRFVKLSFRVRRAMYGLQIIRNLVLHDVRELIDVGRLFAPNAISVTTVKARAPIPSADLADC